MEVIGLLNHKCDTNILLPVFPGALDQPNALEVVYERFRLSAALLHEGPAVTSGHYRAVLQDIGRQVITDDSVSARLLNDQSDGPHCRANYYAICLCLPALPCSLIWVISACLLP